jgi:hypothetical protein
MSFVRASRAGEDGHFRITHPVNRPKPVSELISMLGKFKHLGEEEIAVIQEQTDRRFKTLQALCAASD